MGIKYAKLLLCHGISEKFREKKISIREYNNRSVYYCFNNPFTVDCGIPYLNFPLMPIYDSYIPNKRSYNYPDLLPVDIYTDTGKYIITLTNPSDPPQVILLTYDAADTENTITRDKPACST